MTATIDIDDVRRVLWSHREDLLEQVAATERAIESLGACGLPTLFDEQGEPSEAAIRAADPGPGAPEKRRRFTDEERAYVVGRVKEIGFKDAAIEAGVSEQSVRNWKRELSE